MSTRCVTLLRARGMSSSSKSFAHLTTRKNVNMEEIERYQKEVGSGGWSIKLMTLGLVFGTGWFGYQLQARGRLPWQHSDKVRERLEGFGIKTSES